MHSHLCTDGRGSSRSYTYVYTSHVRYSLRPLKVSFWEVGEYQGSGEKTCIPLHLQSSQEQKKKKSTFTLLRSTPPEGSDLCAIGTTTETHQRRLRNRGRRGRCPCAFRRCGWRARAVTRAEEETKKMWAEDWDAAARGEEMRARLPLRRAGHAYPCAPPLRRAIKPATTESAAGSQLLGEARNRILGVQWNLRPDFWCRVDSMTRSGLHHLCLCAGGGEEGRCWRRSGGPPPAARGGDRATARWWAAVGEDER